MSESLADTSAQPAGDVTLSRAALKALADLPGMACGTLSPLARMQAPSEAARRDLLISALHGMQGEWEWSVPALIDPKLSVAMLLGDGETSLLGQYLWPDAEANGPGFRTHVEGMNLRLSGPVTLGEVQQTLLDFLALNSVGEMEPVRFYLSPEEFWTLAAIADGYHASVLRRRLAREGGRPMGVACRDVMAAWEIGLRAPNPGWAVSLFSLMVPDRVPQAFQNRVPKLLASMAEADLLEPLSGNGGDPLAEVYMFGDGIDLLCQSLAGPAINFGLAVQRQRRGQIELSVLGGWRTSGGVTVADLSQMETGRVDVLLAGPHFVVDLLESTLEIPQRDETPVPFSMNTPFSRAAVLSGLQGMAIGGDTEATAAGRSGPAPAPALGAQPVGAPTGTCRSCGAALKPGAKFCPVCGGPAEDATVGPAVTACPQCGARNRSGTRFCRECGAKLA